MQMKWDRTYGSGYISPSNLGIPPTTRGVKDHSFPYYYWPVVWVNPYGYPFYLYDTPEVSFSFYLA